ncbi:MAG: substrate-binding domain-containing protein [Verrucomicrobia bacterium]|nr:substrate-binding domain-containing protein [Verrucomicrobiota bacterium]
MIWRGVCFGRNLALKTEVPVGWARRWLPLLVYPLFTLIVAAACMVLSEGFWGRYCWQAYYWINIYAVVLVFWTAMIGSPWLMLLFNLGCFVPSILSFAFYQRRLKGLEPMPKGMRVALWMVILACAGAFGYGFYERSQNLIGSEFDSKLIGSEFDNEDVFFHFFDYGYEGIGVDLNPYYPWSKTNLLAKLDEPSTLTLTNKIDWNGTEALYPLYAAFAQAVLPESILPRDVDDEISWKMPYKSGVNSYGIMVFNQVFIQEADIVFYTALSAAQKEQARRANAELTYTPIALDAFVFFVNKDCPIDGLTSQQARDIYSGKIRDWKELGAPAGRILAFQRPPDSSSQNAMERFMGVTPLATPLKKEIGGSMGGIREEVVQYQNVANAIGYSFRCYAALKGDDSIKFLKLDGVEPTPENIASGRYPATVEMLAITSQHSDPECAKLIEWILGPQGQKLVEKTGYIPLHKTDDSSEKKPE